MQVARAAALRADERSLASVGDAATDLDGSDGSGSAFLRDLLRRREMEIEERLLTAVAIAGAPEAGGLLRRCLRSYDAEIRAQAIEALDTLGDRALSSQLVGLLERNDGRTPADPRDVLRGLTSDPDPWVRALAVHTLSGRLRHEWQTTLARARQDSDPIVRAVAAGDGRQGGEPVPQTRDTLGEVERMLFLRRVPLFMELAPEDLQRVAATAVERVYPAGEPLVREGDIGDELVVILEGAVRVVRGEAEDQRTLRTYEAGDHIGELAVLRERPRAATVIALEGGVRGLVIGGEGLRAVLRERPEAAMAMLATLAERISTQ